MGRTTQEVEHARQRLIFGKNMVHDQPVRPGAYLRFIDYGEFYTLLCKTRSGLSTIFAIALGLEHGDQPG